MNNIIDGYKSVKSELDDYLEFLYVSGLLDEDSEEIEIDEEDTLTLSLDMSDTYE